MCLDEVQAGESMRRPLLPYLLLGVGGLFLLAAAVATVHTALFLHSAAHTTGTITDQSLVSQPVTGRRDQVTFRPTITFQTSDGHWFAVTSKTSSSSAHTSGGQWVNTTPQVHDRVPVVYNPADPNKAEIDSFGNLWVLPLAFGGLGVAFATFGLIFYFLAGRP